jgi:putative PIN family toxin of toxin-antitoxin system
MRIVVDTNIWIRALLRGPVTLPFLRYWEAGRVEVVLSDFLFSELLEVIDRPRLRGKVSGWALSRLVRRFRTHAVWVEVTTTPPGCRDPKDRPVLSTAIDARAHAILTGDSDLRGDDELRAAMAMYGVELWGIQTLIERLEGTSSGASLA